MATEPRVYRYRILPDEEQEVLFRQYAGARRFVYNHFLARRKEYYRATGKTLSFAAMCRELTTLKEKPGTAWLREINGQSLQQAIRDLTRAFTNFFEGRAKFPHFKTKRGARPSFRIPQYLELDGNVLVVPKVGRVPLVLHRPAEGVLKSGTFTQDATGAWYVSLVMEVAVVEGPLLPPDPERAVGVDLGLKDLAVLSDGTHVPAPKQYRHAEKKLARLQRKLSRAQKDSRNRTKLREQVARLHHRVAVQRREFLHRLSARLVRQFDLISIEDLHVSALAKTKLAKSVHDAGWGMLREFLTYKALRYHKHLVVVDRYFPSTKTCSRCGWKHPGLTLADRVWTCGNVACGVTHNRDENAAVNLRDCGLRLLLAGGAPDRINAPGETVTPTTGGLVSAKGEATPLAAW